MDPVPKLARQRLERLGSCTGQHHRGALRVESLCDRTADAPARTRHKRCFA